jgi:DNA invertase Pin-like site-specific DNA recombinase
MVDMKYVAYYRVSTKKQGDSGLGLEAQQQIVARFYPTLEQEYIEVESAKTITDRPVLKQAIDFCKTNGYTLVVAKVDRLSRDVKDGLTVLDWLPGQIEFCDLPGKPDRFMLTLYFAFAERERELISIRTKAALQAKKQRGEPTGNPHLFTNKGRVIGAKIQAEAARSNPDNEKATAHALLLREKGLPYNEVAKSLNEAGFRTSKGGQWCTSTVHRVVQRTEAGR